MEDDIKTLWDKGLTMSQIAKQMNTTVGTVAGKINRRREMFAPRTPIKYQTNRPSKNPEGILKLNSNTCRFITNDDTSKPKYCLAPIKRRSYCEEHAALCYLPRRKADD
jgi:hypothetical protein